MSIALPEAALKGQLLAPLRNRRDYLAGLIQEETLEETWEAKIAGRLESVFRLEEDCVSNARHIYSYLGWQAQAWFTECVELTCELAIREAAQSDRIHDHAHRIALLQSFLQRRRRVAIAEDEEDEE